jgi:hypothetical protein
MTRRFVILLAVMLLAGCASAPDVQDMAVTSEVVEGQSFPSALVSNISVTNVAGGEQTNPMWTSEINAEGFKSALIESLQTARLLATDPTQSEYQLIAVIISVEQPLFGFDTTVTMTVDYTILDASSGDNIFHKMVTADYTATISQAFYGVERLKIANEGAARENIRSFLDQLRLLTLSKK